MIELEPTHVNRCNVGHDGKSAYARLMGKHSSKQVLEIRERVLAEILGKKSKTKQALQSRWYDAVWVGIAKRSNEHLVVIEGGPAIRCRTVKRRPVQQRWDDKKIAEIRATARKPNPKIAEEQEVKTDRRPPEHLEACEVEARRADTRDPPEVVPRDFRITKKLLDKHGATLEGRTRGQRGHIKACRDRIEKAMKEDMIDKDRIERRDTRLPARSRRT